jgi:hypothetical protein
MLQTWSCRQNKKTSHSIRRALMQQICRPTHKCRTQINGPMHMSMYRTDNHKRAYDVGLINQDTAYITAQFSSLFPFFSLPFSLAAGTWDWPDAAAWMMARRCFALSSPWSAALTYQTLASRGSRRHPIPISVKYPQAYSAFGRPGDVSMIRPQ